MPIIVPGKNSKMQCHNTTKQSSPFQNNGIKQKKIDGILKKSSHSC